jgi:hypothetical protein
MLGIFKFEVIHLKPLMIKRFEIFKDKLYAKIIHDMFILKYRRQIN